MATHCSILAWKIPWTEESGGLQPMGLQGSHTIEQLSARTCARTYTHIRGEKKDRKWGLGGARVIIIFHGTNCCYTLFGLPFGAGK